MKQPANQNEDLMWYERLDVSPFGMAQAATQAPAGDLGNSLFEMMTAIGKAQVMQREIEQ